MSTWVYVLDEFKPVNISANELLNLLKEDPLKVFEVIKNALAGFIRDAKSVKVYDIYREPSSSALLVEYIVECEAGRVSVKVICSEHPEQVLRDYYIYERQIRKSRVL